LRQLQGYGVQFDADAQLHEIPLQLSPAHVQLQLPLHDASQVPLQLASHVPPHVPLHDASQVGQPGHVQFV
jgi:hypothetical protein